MACRSNGDHASFNFCMTRMPVRGIGLVFVLALLGSASGTMAGVNGCTSSSKCTFPPGGNTIYYCDVVCPGGNCYTDLATDICPGHCLNTPWIPCISDTPCTGTGNVCLGSGTLHRCTLSSPQPDQLCNANADCSVDHVSSCPGCCDPARIGYYAGDTVLTVCGADSTNNPDYIFGRGAYIGPPEVICGRRGDDHIYGNGGCCGGDRIDGGPGNDVIALNIVPVCVSGSGSVIGADGPGGIIYGGDGDDQLWGTFGNDVIFGGNGDDLIVGTGGRDSLHGGAGNDTVRTWLSNWPAAGCAPPDDVIGSLLCGDDGNDILGGWGPGHQCMEGGEDCDYQFVVAGGRSPTSYDLGTSRACFNTGAPAAGDAPCGCDQ